MVTYKTIVVPTDGSENAKRALEHALAVADRNQAELIVVHVANIVSLVVTYPSKSLKIWKKLARKFLTM